MYFIIIAAYRRIVHRHPKPVSRQDIRISIDVFEAHFDGRQLSKSTRPRAFERKQTYQPNVLRGP